MIVVNSLLDSHEVKIIPRYTPTLDISIEVYNETSREVDILETAYTYVNGKLILSFDYTFFEDYKYQVKITEESNVVYRGKIIAINQNTQDYDPSEGLYTYSVI